MSFYIGIEDLAANALIELLQKEKNNRFVTYEVLENYGAAVLQYLLGRGEKAVLILSRDNTTAMFRNYSDFFVEYNSAAGLGIMLKPDKDINDLINAFRGYLAWDVLMAFVDRNTVTELRVH